MTLDSNLTNLEPLLLDELQFFQRQLATLLAKWAACRGSAEFANIHGFLENHQPIFTMALCLHADFLRTSLAPINERAAKTSSFATSVAAFKDKLSSHIENHGLVAWVKDHISDMASKADMMIEHFRTSSDMYAGIFADFLGALSFSPTSSPLPDFYAESWKSEDRIDTPSKSVMVDHELLTLCQQMFPSIFPLCSALLAVSDEVLVVQNSSAVMCACQPQIQQQL